MSSFFFEDNFVGTSSVLHGNISFRRRSSCRQKPLRISLPWKWKKNSFSHPPTEDSVFFLHSPKVRLRFFPGKTNIRMERQNGWTDVHVVTLVVSKRSTTRSFFQSDSDTEINRICWILSTVIAIWTSFWRPQVLCDPPENSGSTEHQDPGFTTPTDRSSLSYGSIS